MLVFIFNDAGGVNVGSVDVDALKVHKITIDQVAALSVPQGVNYFILDVSSLPNDPQEAWELSDDGAVTVNHEKLMAVTRRNMPTLTPQAFDIKLYQHGLYSQVQELIENNFEMGIAYNRAGFFSRTNPFIDKARIALNLTDEQVDEMWMN